MFLPEVKIMQIIVRCRSPPVEIVCSSVIVLCSLC